MPRLLLELGPLLVAGGPAVPLLLLELGSVLFLVVLVISVSVLLIRDCGAASAAA